MSFNIRTLASESNSMNNWDNRKAAVMNFVNTCGADIIGMQEVRQSQFDYIKANLSSNYSALYFPRESGSNPEGLAFVYDSTKFNFISSEKYWLSPTPDTQSKGWGEEYYRIAAVLILEHIETGETVKSINTHGPLNDTANTNAYQLIMDRSVNEGDPFTFLCGDFNASPNQIGYVPVAEELDLKKAACAVGEKSVEMIKSKELLPLTGYVHGGCSPIGMKKFFRTVAHVTAKDFPTICFSGGKIGFQIELPPEKLSEVIKLEYADIIR